MLNKDNQKQINSELQSAETLVVKRPTHDSTFVVLGDLKVAIPDWTFTRWDKHNRIIFENPNGYELPVEVVIYKSEHYLKIGNSTYMVIGNPQRDIVIALEKINAIGNYFWFKFYNRKYSQILHNTDFCLPVDDPNPGEILRLYPVNSILNPCLSPPRISSDVLERLRQKLLRIFGGKDLRNIAGDDLKRVKYNFYMLINYVAIIAKNGDSQDYYDAQNALTALMHWIDKGWLEEITPFDLPLSETVKNRDIIRLILDLKEHILLCRTGANWQKWTILRDTLRQSQNNQKEIGITTERTKTIFERKVTSARLRIPSTLIAKNDKNKFAENWKVAHVEALGEKDIEPLAGNLDVQKAAQLNNRLESILADDEDTQPDKVKEYLRLKQRAMVYGFGETLIGNAIMISLAFAGGSATTVKKIMRKNKLVHLALRVKTPQNEAKWISLLHARAGMILGQNPHSKIAFITNVEGTDVGESESSTLEFLRKEYINELSEGQIYTVNQRSGFLLEPKTGRPLRYKNGHLAIVAENHLWAFFALLLDKNRVVDIIQNTTGIISLGNGDNILNYPRAGMLGEIEYARRLHGRAVATVAIAALSAGDKKGGFAAKITYRNSETGDEFDQLELREISEFPTRGNAGFSAIDISKEKASEFYRLVTENRWFIEDIFQNENGGQKQVAFNVAFYAVDLRLIISRIFGLQENDRDLVRALKLIDDQIWVDKIIEIGEAVPAIEHLTKEAPNENGSDAVKGYMTEQMVQDFIVNALAILNTPEGLPEPEVVIRLCERKDFFLPYKGKNQYELDEEGNPITDPGTGKTIEKYDLIANQKRYAGVIHDHYQAGHRLVLGPNEYVEEVIPVELDIVKEANKNILPQDKILFKKGAF